MIAYPLCRWRTLGAVLAIWVCGVPACGVGQSEWSGSEKAEVRELVGALPDLVPGQTDSSDVAFSGCRGFSPSCGGLHSISYVNSDAESTAESVDRACNSAAKALTDWELAITEPDRTNHGDGCELYVETSEYMVRVSAVDRPGALLRMSVVVTPLPR